MIQIEFEVAGRIQRDSVAKTVEGYILDTYADGQVERVQDRVEHAVEVLGFIVEVLHAKGLIEDGELAKLMPGHRVVR